MKHALSPKTIFSRIIIYSFLILLAFFFLAPVYAMVVSSLKPFAEVSVFTMWELPKSLHLSNFTEAFETLKPHFGNSIYLVIPATILSVLRQGILLIPLVYLLRALFGLNGVILGQSVTDYIAVILSFFLWRKIRKLLEKQAAH